MTILFAVLGIISVCGAVMLFLACYQRGNPDDAKIEGVWPKAVIALILGVIGLILIVASVMVHP